MEYQKNEADATKLVTLDLPDSTLEERTAHANLLLEIEAKKIAATLDVPTLAHQVRDALRNLGEPIRLFGENNANVRDRLRLCLAKIEVKKKGGNIIDLDDVEKVDEDKAHKIDDSQGETTYTHASEGLINAREVIAAYSLENSRKRLRTERKRRWAASKRLFKLQAVSIDDEEGSHSDNEEEAMKELEDLDTKCLERYKSLKESALEGSQYGDSRPLSAISTFKQEPSFQSKFIQSTVVTGGWSGSIKLWDGSSSALNLMSTKNMAHEDRIMGVAIHEGCSSNSDSFMLASASIDLTGKLWQVQVSEDEAMHDIHSEGSSIESQKFEINDVAVLKGHQARLCSVAFHPSGRYVGTTSFDHTWRLWDVESGGKELLLQDGHWKEVYGISFHSDGSICSTTDYGGVVQLWDLRIGKSINHFLGHAKRVLCSEFSPNGFQLCSAGDDGTIKVWDLRQRRQYASIPAHSGLITQLNFAKNVGQNGEFLTSSSFDGTGKVWSTRDWKLISTLRGHEGKVMGIDVLPSDHGIVTCGYDKTLKHWS